MVSESRSTFIADQKQLKENLQRLAKINNLLKTTGIFTIISIASFLLVETDLFAYVLCIGLLGAGIASYCCATATGHGMVDISELGSGCGTFLYLPIYYLMYSYYIFSGWVYGLREKSILLKENERIISKHGTKILE